MVMPTISAKVSLEQLGVIESAAAIKGWSRSTVIAHGALQYANLIIAEHGTKGAAARKAMRQAKARLGGLAKAQKAKSRKKP